MKLTPKQFVQDLGGYRAVALRLGVNEKTMHGYSLAEKLPPKWYSALTELAREHRQAPPPTDLFDFKPLAAQLRTDDAA